MVALDPIIRCSVLRRRLVPPLGIDLVFCLDFQAVDRDQRLVFLGRHRRLRRAGGKDFHRLATRHGNPIANTFGSICVLQPLDGDEGADQQIGSDPFGILQRHLSRCAEGFLLCGGLVHLQHLSLRIRPHGRLDFHDSQAGDGVDFQQPLQAAVQHLCLLVIFGDQLQIGDLVEDGYQGLQLTPLAGLQGFFFQRLFQRKKAAVFRRPGQGAGGGLAQRRKADLQLVVFHLANGHHRGRAQRHAGAGADQFALGRLHRMQIDGRDDGLPQPRHFDGQQHLRPVQLAAIFLEGDRAGMAKADAGASDCDDVPFIGQ